MPRVPARSRLRNNRLKILVRRCDNHTRRHRPRSDNTSAYVPTLLSRNDNLLNMRLDKRGNSWNARSLELDIPGDDASVNVSALLRRLNELLDVWLYEWINGREPNPLIARPPRSNGATLNMPTRRDSLNKRLNLRINPPRCCWPSRHGKSLPLRPDYPSGPPSLEPRHLPDRTSLDGLADDNYRTRVYARAERADVTDGKIIAEHRVSGDRVC